MISDRQISGVASRFGVPYQEFLQRYRAGERYCEEHQGWVNQQDIIIDSTQPFGHRWCCTGCVESHYLVCPECEGQAKVVNRIKRGFDIKLTKQCLDCDHEFDTVISRNNNKERYISTNKVDEKRKIRLNLQLEAELAAELGQSRLDKSCRKQFKEWILA